MNAISVGDTVVHVESWRGGGLREVLRVKIARETKTQWVDDNGTRWRKSDRAMVPQYGPGPRFIMSVTAFEEAKR